MREANHIIDEFLGFINMIVEKLCTVLVAVMTAIVLLQVIARLTPGVKNPSWT